MKKKSILIMWWNHYGQIILLLTIVFLTALISFKLGKIKSNNNTPIDIVIRDIKNVNPAQEEASLAIKALKRQGVNINRNIVEKNKITSKRENKDCLFVASRNSKKYHTKDCKYGKKIKEANLICFKSVEEAKSKGYLPAGGCLGKKR